MAICKKNRRRWYKGGPKRKYYMSKKESDERVKQRAKKDKTFLKALKTEPTK